MDNPTEPMDVEALRRMVAQADSLLTRQREATGLALQLKRQLVWRLVLAQHPGISQTDAEKLVREHGIQP